MGKMNDLAIDAERLGIDLDEPGALERTRVLLAEEAGMEVAAAVAVYLVFNHKERRWDVDAVTVDGGALDATADSYVDFTEEGHEGAAALMLAEAEAVEYPNGAELNEALGRALLESAPILPDGL